MFLKQILTLFCENIMNLLPKSKEEFSQKEYWDSFFKKRGNRSFEWYGEYPELSGYLHKYVKIPDDILIVGCGNSTLGKDLYDVGYRKVTNIDISNVVIRQMLSQNDKERPGLQYIQMDALRTSFDDDKFSAIIDKGTLDALMPDDSDGTVQNVNRYFSEIQRVLRTGGRYICISLLQEHILKKLLDYFPSNNWLFRGIRCFEPESKSAEAMPVFMVVCTKFKALPRKILELNLGSQDKIQKCESSEEVMTHIMSAQKAAFICSALRKSTIDEDSEISLELYLEGPDPKLRYTVYVVEVPKGHKNAPYAAFIVPEGRESEWLFSTKSGRKNLVKMTNNNRLAIVTMHRGQKYESLEAVQNELADIVCNLAPSNLKNHQKIPFLSLGSDLGKRLVRYEGKSEYSGDYIIEDVETDDGQKFRRLFYLNSQLVIQSEARLKTVKSKSGVARDVVDLTHLTCQHHIYMSVGAHVACRKKGDPKICVLGLGGGGLCSFLHRFLPGACVKGVDVDADMLGIATEWFAFAPNKKLTAEVRDGLDYLRQLEEEDETVDAILCDVDNKNADIGMSCPPKEFINSAALRTVSKIISKTGLFIANVVLRDPTLRPEILNDLKSNFRTVVSYKLVEDLNEIFICANAKIKGDIFKDYLREACASINAFFKKNNVKEKVEIVEYLSVLKINC